MAHVHAIPTYRLCVASRMVRTAGSGTLSIDTSRSQMRSQSLGSMGKGAGDGEEAVAGVGAVEGEGAPAGGWGGGRVVMPLCTMSLHTCSSMCFSLRASTSAALRARRSSRSEEPAAPAGPPPSSDDDDGEAVERTGGNPAGIGIGFVGPLVRY